MESFVKTLERVKRDETSGASLIVRELARALLDDLDNGREILCEDAARLTVEAAPWTAATRNLAALILAKCGDPVVLGESIRDILWRIDWGSARLSEYLSGYINDLVVATISYSSTVMRALAIGKPREVRVLESRPGSEGALLAKTLERLGVRVRLFPDSSLRRVLDEKGGSANADLVVLGADAVGESCVANKVGSGALAALAKQLNVEVIVVTDSTKAWPWEDCSVFEENSVREYTVEVYGSIKVRIIEAFEASLVDMVATEHGLKPWGVINGRSLWTSLADDLGLRSIHPLDLIHIVLRRK